MKVASHDFSTK